MSIEYTDESALIAIDEHMRSPKGHWLLAFRFNDNSFLLDRQTSPEGVSRTALFNVELEETVWVTSVAVRKTMENGNMLSFQTGNTEIAIPIGELYYDYGDLEDFSQTTMIAMEPSEFENIMSIYALDNDGNEVPAESIPFLTEFDEGDFAYEFNDGYVLHIYGDQKLASLEVPDWTDVVDVANIEDFGLPMGGVAFDLGGFYLFIRSYNEVA